MGTTVRKIGNSLGVVIPASVLRSLGIAEGDQLVVSESEGRLVLTPEPRDRELTAEQIAIGEAFMERYAKALDILAR